jgi:hypothetical protein
MRVRLTRKLAECVDGVDLSEHREGDVLTLSAREAELLIAEGWAVRVAHRSAPDVRDRSFAAPKPALAADSPQMRGYRIVIRVHDELHDVHERIVTPAGVPPRVR